MEKKERQETDVLIHTHKTHSMYSRSEAKGREKKTCSNRKEMYFKHKHTSKQTSKKTRRKNPKSFQRRPTSRSFFFAFISFSFFLPYTHTHTYAQNIDHPLLTRPSPVCVCVCMCVSLPTKYRSTNANNSTSSNCKWSPGVLSKKSLPSSSNVLNPKLSLL